MNERDNERERETEPSRKHEKEKKRTIGSRSWSAFRNPTQPASSAACDVPLLLYRNSRETLPTAYIVNEASIHWIAYNVQRTWIAMRRHDLQRTSNRVLPALPVSGFPYLFYADTMYTHNICAHVYHHTTSVCVCVCV